MYTKVFITLKHRGKKAKIIPFLALALTLTVNTKP